MTELHKVEQVLPGCDTVLALVRESGRCDFADFQKKLDKRFKARLKRYFEYLRDGKPIQSPEHYRTLKPRDEKGILVAELKTDKYRVYMVDHQGIWYVTHGRTKPKDNQVPGEIQKALDFYKQWKE